MLVPEGSPGERAQTPYPPRIEVRLLGPFEVALAGQTVQIGSPKQRAVLALLALQAGKVVSSDRLCELVWDEAQPASPSATLHSLISRLRRALGSPSGRPVEGGRRDVLRTRDPGWVLDVEPAAVDALRFAQLRGRAQQRNRRGEVPAAAADLAEAVSLWRGAALADVVDAGYLAPHATRLNQARLDAVEDLAEAELACGRPAEALERLEEHIDTNPLRERGWELFMVALYRLGRQAAALRAFQQVRALLADELGLEPSPQLVEVEQRILRHDVALAAPPVWLDARPDALLRATVSTSLSPGLADPAGTGSGAPRTKAEGAGEFADYSVVVVEDHDFQRRTAVQILRGLGVGTVRDAASGAEALQVLQTGAAPDVIICDIDMPGMDGVEFVGRVAAGNLASAVVIASGLETNVLRAVEAVGEGHGLHVLATLEKPLTARRLGDVLRQYTPLSHEGVNAHEVADVSGEALREALENGNVTAEFAPRIDLTTGAVSSAAAVGRCHRPDGSAVPSSLLGPALVREGLVLAFFERVIAASCGLVDQMARGGLDTDGMRVAVDISLLPLTDVALAGRLTEIVQAYAHPPQRFAWELDDVTLARNAAALELLTRLRIKGFRLSMRHTGTGPSWTQQIGRVPLTELMLDGRLVAGATGDPKRFSMVESALAAARDAGLPVVADGCDSRDDFETLLALGCSEAQGRFVAGPMSATEMVTWAITGYQPGAAGDPV